MNFELEISTFRTGRPGIQKVLGDLETEIMELVWERPTNHGTTVRDIFKVLSTRRRIAYTTVMNTMTRLAKKSLLRVEKKDLGYIYYPICTRHEFISHFVNRILEDLFSSFSGETLEGIQALRNPEATAQARHLLDEIARQSSNEVTG
jgi:predicted transcriptional regulator